MVPGVYDCTFCHFIEKLRGNQMNSSDHQPGTIYKLHWIANLRLIPFALVGLITTPSALSALFAGDFSATFFILMAISIFCDGLAIIIFLENRVFEACMDDNGVWIQTGIFPWDKGRNGLHWRDISDAAYRKGFISWLFKSHDVILNHRHTTDNDFVMKNIRNGEQLVREINRKVNELNLY